VEDEALDRGQLASTYRVRGQQVLARVEDGRSSAVIVRRRAKQRSWRHACSPLSSATAVISRCVERASTRRPTRRGSSE
jgi:hypothetical protein